jgi:PIN domain nuclease of toxin-antitoxin system
MADRAAVRLLLDTHAWIWFVRGDNDLSRRAREAIEEPGVSLFLSAISTWEVLVLARRGRVSVAENPEAWVRTWTSRLGIHVVPVDLEVATRSERLEQFPNRDPADRFIAATALVHGLPLVTADRDLHQWGRLRVTW